MRRLNLAVFQQRAELVARWAMVAAFFLFPVKTSLSNVLLAVVLVAWVLAGQYRKRWADIKRHPITLPALWMYGLIVIGIAYSSADWAQVGQHLNKYSKFLILLVFLSLLVSEAVWRARCRKAFMYAMAFVVASTYANIWLQLPWSVTSAQGWGVNHTVVKDHIFQGLCTAVFVLMAWSESIDERRVPFKVFWGSLGALAALSAVYLLIGRTGVVALAFGLLTYVLACAGKRVRWAAALCVSCLFLIGVISSSLAQVKFLEAWNEIQQHRQQIKPGELTIDKTSTGARLMMWTLSIQEISKRPLIGGGTGSYHKLAEARILDAEACAIACVHPHNQFLFFGVEYGLIGVLAFGFYFMRAGQYALKLPTLLKASTLGFLSVFMVGSFVHGSMWLSGEQHLFTYMLALWMSYPLSDTSLQSSSTRLAG